MTRVRRTPEPEPIPERLPRTCSTCRCWHEREKSQGECRRYPKAPVLTGSGIIGYVFPLTLAGDGCGEYQHC